MADGTERERVERAIADAIEDARDGNLDAGRLEAVRELLRTNADARRYYLERNLFDQHLASLAPPTETPSSAGPGPRHRPVSRATLVVASLAVLVGVVLFAVFRDSFLSFSSPPDESRRVATVVHVGGHATITDAAATPRPAENGDAIRSGDTIRTRGPVGTAIVEYPDGSRLSLVGDTTLTLSGDRRKSIVLHGGTLFASVAPQPHGEPLLVATPRDRVEVMGTSFSLGASDAGTDLKVTEGLVRLTRLQDGRSVEVRAGRRVVSDPRSDLKPEVVPAAPDAWSEDFEDGLPSDWETGRPIGTDLPPGSVGAVRAEPVFDDSGREFQQIATPERWVHGLFTAHDDTHLNVTFRKPGPGWINVFVRTRTADDEARFASNYLYDAGGWWSRDPTEWRTVSIPLNSFRRLSPGEGTLRSEIPYQIAFSSPENGARLVVDRAWTSRGGPGVVESRRVEDQ